MNAESTALGVLPAQIAGSLAHFAAQTSMPNS